MKFGRNTMPFCPKCKYEYNIGIAKCPDCDTFLVDELPAEPEEVWVDLVCVASYWSEVEAEAAYATLQSQGIQSVVDNAIVSQANPGIALASGGYKVMVPSEEADKARKILGA